MLKQLGLVAMALLAVGSVAEAAPGGSHGGGGNHGGGGGQGGGGRGLGTGTVSRGGTGSGTRTIVAGPYGLGFSSGNNYGAGGYYGMNGNRFGGLGGRYGGFGGGYYGGFGFGGIGAPLIYGAPMMDPEPPPPPLGPPMITAPVVALTSGPGSITFNVPENALVWVDGQLLDQTGSERDFTTRALSAGAFGSYLVRVKWTEKGEEKTFTQRVTVRASGKASVTVFGRSDPK